MESSFVIASTGPYFPTLTGALLLLLIIAGPFLLVGIVARSLVGSDPVSVWLLGLMVLGGVGTAILVWPGHIAIGWTGFWGKWRIAGVVALLLIPAALFMEAGKRDFLRRPDRPKKSTNKKRKVKRDRVRSAEEPPQSNGVFVRDDS